MAHLPPNPTLRVFQDYLSLVCQERGWTKDTPSEKFVLFIEEVGELAKAMRRQFGLYEERAKQQNFLLEEEFADVFSYLRDLAIASALPGGGILRQRKDQRIESVE
jgi:NTP pyrophosphatase (non-canonical NTP hydrolase)